MAFTILASVLLMARQVQCEFFCYCIQFPPNPRGKIRCPIQRVHHPKVGVNSRVKGSRDAKLERLKQRLVKIEDPVSFA